LDEWTEALETGGRIDVIYTDFEKAFDKVPHKRLLSKLRCYKIDNGIVELIKYFLPNRPKTESCVGFIYGRGYRGSIV